MSNYAIMRIEKRKLGSVSRICNHHERLKEEYKSNPDIDPARTHLNYHIVEPKGRYRKLALDRIAEAGARRKKDSIVLQDGLVTGTPGWMKSMTTEEQRAYFDYAYLFFERHFRRENILSAVVHLDEATPHMHICFVPITGDNRLSSKEIIGGPKGLAAWQDRFYEHMRERYPEIERGMPARVTRRKHIPSFMFKAANELYAHYGEICSAVQDIGMIGNAKAKSRAIELLGRYAPEMAQLKVQLSATDKHISDLENALMAERRVSGGFRNKYLEKDRELEKARLMLYELNKKQQELQRQIALIPPELLERLAREEKARRRKQYERGAR